MNCHSTGLPNQTSGTAHFRPTQGPTNVTGRWWMCLVGSPRSQFIPTVWFCSKWQQSLPFQFQVWLLQGDETPSWCTNNSTILTEGIQDNLGCVQLGWTNNEHFPVCLYSYSFRGTKLAGTESLLPSQAEMDLNWTGTKLNQPQGSCGTPFILLSSLHQQYDSDIMKWHHDCLLLHPGQEKPSHMCSRVTLTHLCICRCPWPTPPYTLHKPPSKFHIPIPMAVIYILKEWCCVVTG